LEQGTSLQGNRGGSQIKPDALESATSPRLRPGSAAQKPNIINKANLIIIKRGIFLKETTEPPKGVWKRGNQKKHFCRKFFIYKYLQIG
jgi:hypothetical protein